MNTERKLMEPHDFKENRSRIVLKILRGFLCEFLEAYDENPEISAMFLIRILE